MSRSNPRLEENIRFVEAVTIFHELYVASGPYKSHVPRLVSEIVTRLEGNDGMKHELLSMFGKRGAQTREQNRKERHASHTHSQSPSHSPSQLELFDGGK